MACLCDFCSAPDAVWRHPARNFIGYNAGGVVGESVGDWAACRECHQLIVSDDRARLTETSVLTFIHGTRSWKPSKGSWRPRWGFCTRNSLTIVPVQHR